MRRTVLFIGEVLFLGFLTLLLGLLIALVVRDGLHRWTGILIPLGAYGLASLWWMLLAFGVPRPDAGRRVPGLVWGGLATGCLLALGLIVAAGLDGNLGLLGQAALYFGVPIGICIDLLLRYRRWGGTNTATPTAPGPT